VVQFDDWPDPGVPNANRDKVPTVISYNNDGSICHWGFDVEPDERQFRWFKFLLEPYHKNTEKVDFVYKSRELLDELNKTAVQVVSDYLGCVWRHVLGFFRREYGPQFETTMFRVVVVLTVPAIWSNSARQQTKDAAVAAGIPGNILIVSEPEAGALAVLKENQALPNSVRSLPNVQVTSHTMTGRMRT
jgi:hypothetical protein